MSMAWGGRKGRSNESGGDEDTAARPSGKQNVMRRAGQPMIRSGAEKEDSPWLKATEDEGCQFSAPEAADRTE
jgi:hypothetical protein